VICLNNEYEKIFVDKFILKSKRPRIAYELTNTKKRKTAIGRFCHNSLDYIEESKIIFAGDSISIDELNNLIKKYTNAKECYLISWNSGIDGSFLDREIALNEIIGYGMASIMVFKNLIVIETEQEQGPAIKYVLLSNK